MQAEVLLGNPDRKKHSEILKVHGKMKLNVFLGGY
jgi:hypothetical protein